MFIHVDEYWLLKYINEICTLHLPAIIKSCTTRNYLTNSVIKTMDWHENAFCGDILASWQWNKLKELIIFPTKNLFACEIEN